MSDIEALLSVDAGRIPPGTLAFFRKTVDLRVLRARALLSGAVGVTAVIVGCAGGRVVATVLLLAAALLAVLATPTLQAGENEDEPPLRNQVIVVTPRGLIGRDEQGLRSWQFDDLATVFTGGHSERPHLVLVERNGSRHAIEYLDFRDGERLREVIDARLRRPR